MESEWASAAEDPCTGAGRGSQERSATRSWIHAALPAPAAGKDASKPSRPALLRELTKGDADAVTAQDVAVAAGMNDGFAVGLLEAAGSAVGLALANAAAILDPSVVVLGGGLVSSGRVFLDAVRGSVALHLMPGMRQDMRIEVSALGLDGSARGMALIAAEEVFAGGVSNGE
jgi:glucokinase